MGDAFMARRNSGGFYRYEGLVEFTKNSNNTLTVTLKNGLTWGDVEDCLFMAGGYYYGYYYTFVKESETKIRIITKMSQDTEYSTTRTISPTGNSFKTEEATGGWQHSTWSILWLRKPI